MPIFDHTTVQHLVEYFLGLNMTERVSFSLLCALLFTVHCRILWGHYIEFIIFTSNNAKPSIEHITYRVAADCWHSRWPCYRGRDVIIIKFNICIQLWVSWSLINVCRANTELFSYNLCCAALDLSEHTMCLWGRNEASFPIWVVEVLFLHVFSADSKLCSVLFHWVPTMTRTPCFYRLGTH